MGAADDIASSPLGSRVEVVSVVDTITSRLEAAIMTGALPAGERLSEQSLAARFGTSRGPLREAMRRLEGRGLIERRHNIGARVLSLSIDDLHELLIIREALEGIAARLAAERMSDAEIAELNGLLQRGPSATANEDLAERSSSGKMDDGDFHLRIITGSKNKRLVNLIFGDTFYLFRVYRFRASGIIGRREQAHFEHLSIAATITARDAEGAEKAMRYHLQRSHQNMLQNIELVLRPPNPAEALSFADKRRTRRSAAP